MSNVMSIQEKLELITRNTEEVLTQEDLEALLRSDRQIKHYIGFEISGRIHLGTGLMCMAKVKDFLDAGLECTIFLADWHTWINDKLEGNRDTIKQVAQGYFREGLKAALQVLGGDPERLHFVLGSDLYHHNDSYWETVIEVSKNTTLARIQRSTTVLGRKEGEHIDFAKLIYPPMQVADIFSLGIDIAHAGLDQRKAQVIARDTAMHLNIHPLINTQGQRMKPIAVHHHLILGIRKPPIWPPPTEHKQDFWASMKMSKSDPDSAIFIDDTSDEIKRKVSKAFCPMEITFNPILDWVESLVFREPQEAFRIDRTPRDGGLITFYSYEELATAYKEGQLHPMDLKSAVAEWLIQTLEPVRWTFSKNEELSAVRDKLQLLSQPKSHK